MTWRAALRRLLVDGGATIRGVPLHVSPWFVCSPFVLGYFAERDVAGTALDRVPVFDTLEESLHAFDDPSVFAEVNPSLGWALAAGLGVAVVYVLSVVAHEFGHLAAARRAGVGVGSMQLHVAGGYVEIDDDDSLTAGKLTAIAAAGPLVTAALALVAAVALTVLGWPLLGVPIAGSGAEAAIGRVLSAAFALNIVGLIVNLVPVRALDGGHLLRAAKLWRARSGR